MRGRLRSTPIVLLAIVALGFALRVVQLDFQPLWWDEGYTVFFVTRDFATMLARTAIDIHPPLYYALLQLWTSLAGNSALAFRLFSVAVGVATIPLIYLVGRQWFNPRVGLLGAFLLALAPLHIYYSQEVRMYGLVMLLTLASMAMQLHILSRRSPARWTWLAYILATAAALYTLYYAAFILVTEIVVALLNVNIQAEQSPLQGRLKRPSMTLPGRLQPGVLRPWLGAWLAILLLYLPWLAYTLPKLYTYVTAKVGIEQYAPLDPLTYLAQHLIAFSAGHLLNLTWLGASALLFVALATWGIREWRITNYELRMANGESRITNDELRIPNDSLLILFLVPLLLGWLVNFRYPVHPFGYERSLLTIAPLFYLFVGCGLDALWRRRALWAYAGLAALVLISAVSLYDFYTTPRYEKEDYRQLIGEMENMAQPGDAVLAPYPWQIGYLAAYYRGAPLNLIEVPGNAWLTQSAQMDQALTSIRAASPRVWFFAYQTKGRLLEDQVANFFANDYVLWDEWYGNTRLEYFARGEDPPLVEHALAFAPDLQLASFGVGAESPKAGADFIRVRLHWQAKSNAYNYSLRLVDRTGEKRLQWDAPVPSGNEMARQGLFVPRTLSPGPYTLRLVAYHRADASPLALSDGQAEIELSRLVVNPAP